MIDLCEGESDTKGFLVEIDGGFGNSKNQVSSEVFLKLLPHEDSLAWVHTIVIFENFEFPCADCK
jgi:hypothetical protein